MEGWKDGGGTEEGGVLPIHPSTHPPLHPSRREVAFGEEFEAVDGKVVVVERLQVGEAAFGEAMTRDYLETKLRFFDHYLKGETTWFCRDFCSTWMRDCCSRASAS